MNDIFRDEPITKREKGIVAMVRYNLQYPPKEIRKEWIIGRFSITFSWTSSKGLWGRFGGGWQWCLGFEFSGRTLAFNLLIFRLSFYLARKETNETNNS